MEEEEGDDNTIETPEVLFADRELTRLLRRIVDNVGLRAFAQHAGVAHSTVAKLLSGEINRVNPAIASALGYRHVAGWAPLGEDEYDSEWIDEALTDAGEDDAEPPEAEEPGEPGKFIQIEE